MASKLFPLNFHVVRYGGHFLSECSELNLVLKCESCYLLLQVLYRYLASASPLPRRCDVGMED